MAKKKIIYWVDYYYSHRCPEKVYIGRGTLGQYNRRSHDCEPFTTLSKAKKVAMNALRDENEEYEKGIKELRKAIKLNKKNMREIAALKA